MIHGSGMIKTCLENYVHSLCYLRSHCDWHFDLQFVNCARSSATALLDFCQFILSGTGDCDIASLFSWFFIVYFTHFEMMPWREQIFFFLSFCFCFGNSGDGTQGITHARSALYHPSSEHRYLKSLILSAYVCLWTI